MPLESGSACSGTYLPGCREHMLKMSLPLREPVKVCHRLRDSRVFLEGFMSLFQSFTALDPVLE